MLMRYRFPEVFQERNTTPWRVAKAAAIPASSLYRLAKKRGQVSVFDGPFVEALCAALKCGLSDVLELDRDAERPAPKAAKRR